MKILELFGILIEKLIIAKDLEFISKKLTSFFEVVHQSSTNIQDPLLVQFIRYLSSDTDLGVQCQCNTALAEFELLNKDARKIGNNKGNETSISE